MSTPAAVTVPRAWFVRAALAGVLAISLGALLCTSRYVALPGALELDWSWVQMPLAIALFVLVSGVSLGVGVGGATLFAARRGARVPGLLLAGAIGGALGGLAPGVLGIAGFGSLSAPYAGTANILSSSLLGAIAFVALWSPQLFPSSRPGRSMLLHLGRAAIASVVSLGAFGMLAWSMVGTIGFIPSFHALADASLAIGLLPFSLLVGAILGAIGGAAIGAACALVGRMSR
jgi:hypothetical protein